MKRILQAVVVAALFTGIQAQAEDAPIVVPSQWTFADRAAPGGAADAFAGSAPDMIVLESKSTRADSYAASNAQEAVVSAFPGSAPEMIVLESRPAHAAGLAQGEVASAFPGSAREDPIVVESISTHADKFAGERPTQARGASDPALSQ